MKILGLDVGEKRIGVAKVDSNTRIAVPVGVVNVDGSEWQEIARISRLTGTNWFVLGMPRSNEGNETKQSLYVRQFAKTLTERIPGAKVRFQDESLTSVEAEERIKQRENSKKGKKSTKNVKKQRESGEIDAEAATIILQDFIENFREYEKDMIPEARKVSADASFTENAAAVASNVAGVAKKNGDKMALNAKKVQHQGRKLWKIIAPIVVIVLIAAGIGVGFWYREEQARQRAEYYAELEAAMKAEVFSFTILPGETVFDVKEKLRTVERSEELTGYTEEEIEAGFAVDYREKFDFLPEGGDLEGYLFGETYEFYADDTVEAILTRYLEGMAGVISENKLEEQYAKQGLSLNEGVTLASIVQKEAPTAEMATVAQVFLSRLEVGVMLGSDVTVSYALDVADPERAIYKDNQAALKVDSCYNTRLYRGLPCGPISNPGLSALLAVANPADTEYFYFLTGDDGLMYYSYTESEHISNIRRYCRELCDTSL